MPTTSLCLHVVFDAVHSPVGALVGVEEWCRRIRKFEADGHTNGAQP